MTRRIFWSSTTIDAFARCCRASCVAEGYRVSTAETAQDARAKLEGLNFDLLVLDVMMPGESGFDFARTLRTSSTVPILMLTARDEKESRIMGLEIGADDYLAKPFEPGELSLRVANILKRARPPRASTGGIGAVRPVRISSCARRAATRRRGDPADRPRARYAANIDGKRRARPCRARRSPAMAGRSASAPSTCRSIGFAARSSAIPPIR